MIQRGYITRFLALLSIVFGVACGQTHGGGPNADPPHREPEPAGRGSSNSAMPVRDAGPATDPAERSCAAEQSVCAGSCVDTSTSRQHCGGCGRACAFSQICASGRCERDCGSQKAMPCGNVCADFATDARNCGACGHACGEGESCVSGKCGCRDGESLCDGLCQPTLSGACGPCGDQCPDEEGCTDGVSHTADWPTLGADMMRSGYNAGERGQPPLEEGWAVSLIGDALNPVAVSGELVFASGRTRFRERGPLLALDLESGETVWTYDFGEVSSVGQPSVVDCRVYIQNSASTDSLPSTLWSLDAASGDAVWSHRFPSQWEHYWSPTVTSEAVYVNAGTYGGLFGFSRGSGAELFQNTELEQYSEWVAATYGGDVYTFVEGELRRHDADDGTVIGMMSVTWDWDGWSMLTGPVLSPDGIAFVAAPPTLYAFEVASKQLVWSHASNVSGMPALAEGLVLAFDSQLLTALDASTGAVQWRCDQAEALVHAPVVANGFAYVASRSATYAVDLRDGQVVWQTATGGWLSIGGGRLFIAAEDGILHSYVLTQPSDE